MLGVLRRIKRWLRPRKAPALVFYVQADGIVIAPHQLATYLAMQRCIDECERLLKVMDHRLNRDWPDGGRAMGGYWPGDLPLPSCPQNEFVLPAALAAALTREPVEGSNYYHINTIKVVRP